MPLILALLSVLCLDAVSRGGPADDTTLGCVQPQLAATGSDAYVTCGSGEAIYVARALDGGAMSGLSRVGALGGLALGAHRGPRVVAIGHTVVVAAAGRARAGEQTEIWAWRSDDRGGTWSGPVRVTDAPNAAEEGLHALAASRTTIALAWLDMRRGAMSVYGSVSHDEGRTWSPNAPLYTRDGGAVCTCCHPSLAVDEHGTVTVMFRNDIDGNRDMYLRVGEHDARRLGREHWRLSACPMDGGGLAAGQNGATYTAWRRQETVYVAGPDERETPLGTGKDPAIAALDDRPVVAWTAPSGLVMSTLGSTPRLLDPAGRFASIAAGSPTTLWLAWQRGERAVVRRLEGSALP